MPDLDYAAWFAAMPSPYVVVGPDLTIVAANQAYLEATGRTREQLVGHQLFDAFPESKGNVGSLRKAKGSIQRVIETGRQDSLILHYAIPVADKPGEFDDRWWSPVFTPIFGADGKVEYVFIRSDDVTEFVRSSALSHQMPSVELSERIALEAELYDRARELHDLNEELRQANLRDRQVAVTLQEAMLLTPDLEKHPDAAVRYRPAIESFNVCGDWYDLVDLAGDRFALGVGDVVGHGLEAAAVMGMLRSVLNAAIRALERPAHALEVLTLYARSMEGALNTTAVEALVDPGSGLIIYSNSGHPPPALVRPDRGCELLDQHVDPPLGARPRHVPCSQAGHPYTPGDTLVLYTDGLIERRGEGIDIGLDRLCEVLTRHCGQSPPDMADAVLEDLGVAEGGNDDISLIVVRL
ncbi:SpoIIE family protein phosphatase [Glycomyces sp. NPDC049804]|uniref:PP2C family protein-serine/threonine phosphatase n=1 Tax=Glycomyces sp. NPDC049804 TaxID=3154363 RepID=UPI003443DBC3